MVMGKFLADMALVALGGLTNMITGRAAADSQAKHNKALAKYEHEKNIELLQYQLSYNSPKAQRKRFEDAGYNPNLAYGQGTPGNLESPPRYPSIRPADMSLGYSGFADIGLKFQQARLMSAQADLTSMKVDESGIKQDMMKAQTDLVKANPYLNESYVSLMISQMESAAAQKAQQTRWLNDHYEPSQVFDSSNGYKKMDAELALLQQRFRLGESDQKVKAEVLTSKEFQNALNEIQLKWMKDAEITPEHIRMFIMMLLGKFK